MKLLSIREASTEYGISDKMLYEAIHAKDLRAVRLGKPSIRAKYLIPEESLKDWIERRSTV